MSREIVAKEWVGRQEKRKDNAETQRTQKSRPTLCEKRKGWGTLRMICEYGTRT